MKPGQVRIIAGKWRGRRLTVLNRIDLRPTPDRIRETLFNWLAPVIVNARCLDLFAGSGVLGFEALSRGAHQVVMVDESAEVVEMLHKTQKELGTEQAEILRAQLPEGLLLRQEKFDLVFLDPPYQSDLLFPCCHYLENNGFLAETAYIYLEFNQKIQDNDLPINWTLLKSRRAGNVFYHLAERTL